MKIDHGSVYTRYSGKFSQRKGPLVNNDESHCTDIYPGKALDFQKKKKKRLHTEILTDPSIEYAALHPCHKTAPVLGIGLMFRDVDLSFCKAVL